MAIFGGLFDKFRIQDEDDLEYEEDDEDIFDEDDDDGYSMSGMRKRSKGPSQAAAKPTFQPQQPAYQSAPPVNQGYNQQPQREARRQQSFNTHTASDKLVAFDGGAKQARAPKAPAQNEVYVIRPQELDDAQTITDFLKRGKAIVINMEGLQIEPAQRIIDFVGGACYGIGGELKAISSTIFIAVPNSIEVSGDLREEILSSSAISPILNQ